MWKYRATKKLSQTGLYQAEFRHPLDIKTGSLDNLTSRQGNILRRVISKERNSEAYAEMIIDELNQILAEPDYWLGEGKNLALKKFREETINLFIPQLSQGKYF
ncbi:MAG: hypothetical protein E7L01_13865 [Paenibacillus macerans]|nr:hypothetical protein [Paenibacillus macerans]MCY7558454.1 hypothetical protein [Paenibacillus macerans]MDU7474396.1 hypothetical protein [Paenibacillus macerans]MEC0150218.1 hypothetical protein [Paenibacillus macerans]MEC0331957.1 hypothetical protein [Paenibacillus macerans]